MDGETELRGIVTRSRRRLSVEPETKPVEAASIGTPTKRKPARGVSAEKDAKLSEDNSAATPTKRRPTRTISVVLTDLAEDAILVTPSKMTPDTRGKKSILPQEAINENEVLDTPSKRTRSRKSIAEEPQSDSSVPPNTPTSRNARINASAVNSPIRRMISRRYSVTGNENFSPKLEVVPPNKRTRTVSSVITSPVDSSKKVPIKPKDPSTLAKEGVEEEQEIREDAVSDNSLVSDITKDESINVVKVDSPRRSVSPVKKSSRLSGKPMFSPCKACPEKSDENISKTQINKSPKTTRKSLTPCYTDQNTVSKIQSLSRSLPYDSKKKTKFNNSLPGMKVQEVSLNVFAPKSNTDSKHGEIEPMDVDESFNIVNEENKVDSSVVLPENDKTSIELHEKNNASFNLSLGSNSNLHLHDKKTKSYKNDISDINQSISAESAANKTKEISINIHNDDNTSVKVSFTSLSTSINITKNSLQENDFTNEREPPKSEQEKCTYTYKSDPGSDLESPSPNKSKRGGRKSSASINSRNVSLNKSHVTSSDSDIVKEDSMQFLSQTLSKKNFEANISTNNKIIPKSSDESNNVTQLSNSDSCASLTSTKTIRNSNSFHHTSIASPILSKSHCNTINSTGSFGTLENSNIAINETANEKLVYQSESFTEKQNVSNKSSKDKSALEDNIISHVRRSSKRLSKAMEKEDVSVNNTSTEDSYDTISKNNSLTVNSVLNRNKSKTIASVTSKVDTIEAYDTKNEYPMNEIPSPKKTIKYTSNINDYKNRCNLLKTEKDTLECKTTTEKLCKSLDREHRNDFKLESSKHHLSFEDASIRTPKKHNIIKNRNLVTSTPNTNAMRDSPVKNISNTIQATKRDSSVEKETSILATNNTTEESEDSTSDSLIDECEEADDNYESGDSMESSEREYVEKHEIKDLGETLDTESSLSNSSNDKDSFFVSSDDEDRRLLSGTGDDLSSGDDELNFSAKSKNKFNDKARKAQKEASREMYQSRHNKSNQDSDEVDGEIIKPKMNKKKSTPFLSDEEPYVDSKIQNFGKPTNDSTEVFNISNNSQNITVIDKKSKNSLDKSNRNSTDNLKSELSFHSKGEIMQQNNEPLANLIEDDDNTESSLSEGDNVKSITNEYNLFLENLQQDHKTKTRAVDEFTNRSKSSFVNNSIDNGGIAKKNNSSNRLFSKSMKNTDMDKSLHQSEISNEIPLKRNSKSNISNLDESNLGIEMLFQNRDCSFGSCESKENLSFNPFNKELDKDVIPLKRSYGNTNLMKSEPLSNNGRITENNKSMKSKNNSMVAKSLHNSDQNNEMLPLKQNRTSNISNLDESNLGIDVLFQNKEFSVGSDESNQNFNVSHFDQGVITKKLDDTIEGVICLKRTSGEINIRKDSSSLGGHKNVEESQRTSKRNKGKNKSTVFKHNKEKTKLETPTLSRLPDYLLNSLKEEGEEVATEEKQMKKKVKKSNALIATTNFMIDAADNNKIPLELDTTFVDEEPPTCAGDTGKIKVFKKSKIHVPFVDYKASRAGSTSEFNVISSCSTTKFKIVTANRDPKNCLKSNEFLASHVVNFKNDRLFGPNVKRQSVKQLNQENEKLLASGRQHVRK